MVFIQASYPMLGVRPNSKYQGLDAVVLRHLLSLLNPGELKKDSEDVFGHISGNLLTQLADQKDHVGSELPDSAVHDPEHGSVRDPACGSAGIFFQGTCLVEEHGHRLAEQPNYRHFRVLHFQVTKVREAADLLPRRLMSGEVAI